MQSSTFSPLQAVANKIINQLDSGDIPWVRPWRKFNLPAQNLVTRRPYNGINTMLLGAENWGTPFFLTFKQCQSLGGTVKKGEKGSLVVFWKFLDRQKENGDELINRKIPMLRYYTVFNSSQCDLPDGTVPTVELRDFSNDLAAWAAVSNCIADYVARERLDLSTGDHETACYIPSRDRVEMPASARFESLAYYQHVLLHELSHSTGADHRLGRLSKRAHFGTELYSVEELTAELSSCMVSSQLGVDLWSLNLEQNSVAYCQSWAKAIKKDPRMILSAASAAEKSANLILGNHELAADEDQDAVE